jgi:hypothetical protein
MLRIVVSTANLIDQDWRDIEDTVWIQDVPRRPSPIPHELKADDFPSKLESNLYAIDVAPSIVVLSRLVYVAPVCVFLSCGANMVFSGMPTFHSILFVPVCFPRAGASPAYAQHLSRASQGSTWAGLLLSSRDIQPSCAPSTC